MGTPSYMSPEQIEARPVDGRSDQFSLAVLAYELLSGTRPFQGDSLSKAELRFASCTEFVAALDAKLRNA